MKVRHTIFTTIVVVLIVGCILTLKATSKSVDSDAGIIYFPVHKVTATIDASRDMHYDLGWTSRSEAGSDSGVTVSSVDQNGKKISIDFANGIMGGRATVIVEAGSLYSRSEITTELARRIGIQVEAEALPTVNHQ
jgi:hypothetical protein